MSSGNQMPKMAYAVDRSAAVWPRERLLLHGAHTLTDAELVAVLLGVGNAGDGALAVAERLLRTVGGVPGLARSHPEELCRLPGLGRATVARLVAALALPLRRDSMGLVRATCPAELVPVFRPVLAGLQHERLVVAVCDRRKRVRAVRAVAEGATDGAPLPIRDLIATVLRHDGHAFAIAHNHPSGNPEPSAADRNATMRCRRAAETAGLEFLSHVVLGEHDSWELA